MCHESPQADLHISEDTKYDAQSRSKKNYASVLIAVPARDDKKAEVYQFPEEKLRYVVPRAQAKDTGTLHVTMGSRAYRRKHAAVIVTILSY